MKVVVTGASGRKGRALVATLRARGDEVIALRGPSSDTSSDEGPVVDLGRESSVDALRSVLCEGAVVVHLAASHPTHPASSAFDDLRALLDVNVLGTMRLLEACRAVRPSKIVFVSTCDVLPEGVGEALDEEAPTRPTHDLAVTKLAGEDHLRAFEEEEGVAFTALRLATLIGEGDRLVGPLAALLGPGSDPGSAALAPPGWRSSWLASADVWRAIVMAIEGPAVGVVHVAAPEPCGEAEAARIVGATSRRPHDGAAERRAGGVVVATNKARVRLGFEASVTLEAAIAQHLARLR